MKSMRSRLVNTLSFVITGFMLAILLATDIAVDSWIDNEFNRGMSTKAGLLMTLVHEHESGIEFDFAGEFLPEFQGDAEPEYYQLWYDGEVFELSESLKFLGDTHFEYKKLLVGESEIFSQTLPDGRDGRIVYTRFIPQIDSSERPNYSIPIKPVTQTPMTLAYATSAESIEFVLWLIDIVFLIVTLIVIIFIRMFVSKSVDNSLRPLNNLNQEIRQLSIVKQTSEVQLTGTVKELLPVVDSLNRFIKENRQLYLREKRLTSDITHELKTPIAELINLTEVAIRFPDDQSLHIDFKPQVLKISLRLKNIVSNLLLLHKYSDNKFDKNDACDVNQVLERTIESTNNTNLKLALASNLPALVTNVFALESILSNLVNNALQHSPPGSNIYITTRLQGSRQIQLTISNEMSKLLTERDLAYIFAPLWQKDNARSSDENFGLGLSIAKAFARGIDAELSAVVNKHIITFTLLIEC